MAIQVFIDENQDGLVKPADQKDEKSFPLPQHSRVGNQQVHQEPLSIFIDDEENDRTEDGNPAEDSFEKGDICNSREDDRSASHGNVFAFPSPKDLPSAVFHYFTLQFHAQCHGWSGKLTNILMFNYVKRETKMSRGL